ncbi:MAG: hypothetical protein IAG13_35265 [Deltaproteobacteria bacterium]|nr:hypothetical protein [Nannocystaceae bacterium]
MTRWLGCLVLVAIAPACIALPSVIGEGAESSDGAAASGDEEHDTDGATGVVEGSGGEDPCAAGCTAPPPGVVLDAPAHALELEASQTPVVLFAREDAAPLLQRFSSELEPSAAAFAVDVPADEPFGSFVISPSGRAGLAFVGDELSVEIDRLSDDLTHARWTAHDGPMTGFEDVGAIFRTDTVQVPSDDSVRLAVSFNYESYGVRGGGYYFMRYRDGSSDGASGLSTPSTPCTGMFLVGDGDDATESPYVSLWSLSNDGTAARHYWVSGGADTYVTTPGARALAPVRFGGGYLQSGAASDAGGVWLQRVDASFIADEPVFDPPAAGPTPMPLWTTAVDDRIFVLASETTIDGVGLSLREYDANAALVDVVGIDPIVAGASAIAIVDVAVASDGSIYALGHDTPAAGDPVHWLRRIVP